MLSSLFRRTLSSHYLTHSARSCSNAQKIGLSCNGLEIFIQSAFNLKHASTPYYDSQLDSGTTFTTLRKDTARYLDMPFHKLWVGKTSLPDGSIMFCPLSPIECELQYENGESVSIPIVCKILGDVGKPLIGLDVISHFELLNTSTGHLENKIKPKVFAVRDVGISAEAASKIAPNEFVTPDEMYDWTDKLNSGEIPGTFGSTVGGTKSLVDDIKDAKLNAYNAGTAGTIHFLNADFPFILAGQIKDVGRHGETAAQLGLKRK